MPEIITGTPSNVDGRSRDLGKGVGGHDGLGRRPSTGSGARRPAISAGTPANFFGSSGSPITPVEARNTSSAEQPSAAAAYAAEAATEDLPFMPGKGVGIAGIDQQRPRHAARRACSRHQSTAAEGHLRARQHAGNGRALVDRHQQHIGAVLVLDPGLGRGKAHAGDVRQFRVGFGGERGNRMGHGNSPGCDPNRLPHPSRRCKADCKIAPRGTGHRAGQRTRPKPRPSGLLPTWPPPRSDCASTCDLRAASGISMVTPALRPSNSSRYLVSDSCCCDLLGQLFKRRRRARTLFLDLDDVPAELLCTGSEISPTFRAKAASSNGFTIGRWL